MLHEAGRKAYPFATELFLTGCGFGIPRERGRVTFVCPSCQNSVADAARSCSSCGEAITDFLREHHTNPIDGKYRILSVLGIGGMGEIYKALHVHLHALRVIKLMRANITAELDAHDRFMKEARAAIRIQHPNVAALYDFSTLPDGSFYMVWEFIDGTTLLERIREQAFLSPVHAVTLAVQALAGLDAIHRAGFVHRDISPENLMVTRDEEGYERIKIIDLGIAKERDSEAEKTKTGLFVGKLKYCSPEQLGMLASDESIDGRADLYSFGLVLYQMLTGEPPFQAESPHQYLMLQTSKMPVPMATANPNVSIPSELEAVVFRSIAKNREERYPSAVAFARALEAAEPIPAEDRIGGMASSFSTIARPLTIATAETSALSVPVESETRVLPANLETDSQSAALPKRIESETRVLPSRVEREETTGGTSTRSRRRTDGDPAQTRRWELIDQVDESVAAGDFQRADVAFQTLRMHVGVKGESDTEFKRLRRELEFGAQAKEDWFVGEIELARDRGNSKEVARLLGERDQRLGKRFVNAAFRLQVDQWLRRRTELFERARALILAEAFERSNEVLDDLTTHLGAGAAHDEELRSLRQVFRGSVDDTNTRIGRALERARKANDLAEARKVLRWYDSKFGSEASRPPAIQEVDDWVCQKDAAWRSVQNQSFASTPKLQTSSGSGKGLLIFASILVAMGGTAYFYRSDLVSAARSRFGAQYPALFASLEPPKGDDVSSAQRSSTPPSLNEANRQLEGFRWINASDGQEYVWVPGGSFEMGCVRKDRLCDSDERPVRRVSIEGFWLGRTEVTVDAWARFRNASGDAGVPVAPTGQGGADPDQQFLSAASVGFGPDWKHPFSSADEARGSWPVTRVSWAEAEAFCRFAGGRLPTEEEWEYAARNRDERTAYAWGDMRRPLSKVANLADDVAITTFRVDEKSRGALFGGYLDGYDTYAPAGALGSNRLGISDLTGNVWEWCGDWYDRGAYARAADTFPAGPAEGRERVIRGGSWASSARDARVSARGKLAPDVQSSMVGCRCVIPGQ